eukprot:jgi/Psemu1/63970/estExt_Genemark1.C_430077
MALRAFHDNPGIGGFGENGTPVLLLRDRNHSSTHQRSQHRSTPGASNDGIAANHHDSSDRERSKGGDGDLLCQIVKELVDNAVDACRKATSRNGNEPAREPRDPPGENGTRNRKRVRVDIRPTMENGHPIEDLLQVTVTDNGCGMENIQRCVSAFHSSKGGSATNGKGNESKNSSSKSKRRSNGIATSQSGGASNDPDPSHNHTSGRYGMGLTLCLLHGQRCVPNSRACISSATPTSKHRKRAFFQVNRAGDSVDCVREEVPPNDSGGLHAHASGTCGGSAAKRAWPRLHDYFTRFRLCPDLHFELDVFAPTLSRVPIFVRPFAANRAPIETEDKSVSETSQEQVKAELLGGGTTGSEDPWGDLMEDDDQGESDNDNDQGNKPKHWVDTEPPPRGNAADTAAAAHRNADPDRLAFFNAARSFWPKRNLRYQNVARSVRSIRGRTPDNLTADGTGAEKAPELRLEVGMVVCPRSRSRSEESPVRVRPAVECAADTPSCGNGEGEDEDDNEDTGPTDPTASLQLVRMVNGVPILDGAEGHSCGLVHGLANKIVWGSFGLDVDKSATMSPEIETGINTEIETNTVAHDPSSYTPRFRLRDSHLIVPFLGRNQNHKQLERRNSTQEPPTNKNKRTMESVSRTDLLLPANVRIGTILVVVDIHAAPSSLPLPTLSKGRLPLHHRPIDSTLQLGLRDCLSSLQSTNPSLLLTTAQLRAVERDVRYIPGIAATVSRIVCLSHNPLLRRKSLAVLRATTKQVRGEHEPACTEPFSDSQRGSRASDEQSPFGTDASIPEASVLADALERRLRLAMKAKNEAATANKRCKKRSGVDDGDKPEERYRDFDSDEESRDTTKPSRTGKPGSISLSPSSSTEPGKRLLESDSDSELSLLSVPSSPRHGMDGNGKGNRKGKGSDLPFREIVVGNRCNLEAGNRNEIEAEFDDWW